MTITAIAGGIILAIAIRTALPPTDPRPIGLVDEVDLLADASSAPSGPVDVLFYAGTQAAANALGKGQIQTYYHLPPLTGKAVR